MTATAPPKETILVVDDEEPIRQVLKQSLEAAGYEVLLAVDGLAGLTEVRKERPDLIVLDVMMPKLNGFDVAATLHEEDLVMQTPIVALTANVIKKREEYLQNGMDDVIAKPVKKSRVVEVLNMLFAESEVDQPAPEAPPRKKLDSSKLLTNILDMELLQMLVDTIGEDMVRASVKVFHEKMPEYMEILQLSLSADEKSEVCAQAHKIKGAASSVGLARVQRIANQIQQGDHPAWWQNVHDWVEELQMAVPHDMEKLHDWLKEQTIDD